jgi:hypothetical protein
MRLRVILVALKQPANVRKAVVARRGNAHAKVAVVLAVHVAALMLRAATQNVIVPAVKH